MSENFLLQAIIECYPDGILIVGDRGQVIATNQSARHICQRLAPPGLPENQVPPPLWKLCQVMIQNRAELQDPAIMIDDQLALKPAGCIRVRVQWALGDGAKTRLMVTLEDTFLTAERQMQAERQKYGLTPREAEVWLLRRANCTYKAIASQLHITVDTVKKHMKSIYAKRNTFHWMEE